MKIKSALFIFTICLQTAFLLHIQETSARAGPTSTGSVKITATIPPRINVMATKESYCGIFSHSFFLAKIKLQKHYSDSSRIKQFEFTDISSDKKDNCAPMQKILFDDKNLKQVQIMIIAE